MKQKLFVAFLLAIVGMFSSKVLADTVAATSNSSSGIQYANYTATLSDGTILGYYYYYGEVYFCGAVSTAKHIVVPDEVVINSNTYSVKQIGYYNMGKIDLSKSTAAKEMTFGESISNIKSAIPSNIEDLHLKSLTPPSLDESSCISVSTTVWVPQSAYASYQSVVQNTNSYWYGKSIHYEGWTSKSITVNVKVAGSFANELLKNIDQWNEVDELIVSGSLNNDDMSYFSRMSQLTKLDLSQTDITNISGCTDLKLLKSVVLPASVRTISDDAFRGCTSLSVINTENVQDIGSYSFYQCYILKNLNLSSVVTIGKAAFALGTNYSNYYDHVSGGLVSVDAPNLKNIDDLAFQGCINLSSLHITNVTNIGQASFANCPSIPEIILPNVETLGSYCFYIDSRLDYLTPALSKITLSEKITSLPYDCFYAYTGYNVSNFDIPTSVKTISDNAISNLKINALNIPEGVMSLGKTYLPNATAISVPSTLKNMGYLSGSRVNDLYCYVICPLNDAQFDQYLLNNCVLHVPAISLSQYKLHDVWYKFNQIIPIDEKISNLNISGDFAIFDYNGFEDNVNVSINYNEDTSSSGHLTINADGALNIGNFTQYQNFKYEGHGYYDENDNYVCDYTYPYCTTLITNNEVRANNVTTKIQLPTNQWSFVSFPYDVNVSNIVVPEGTMWVARKYNGSNRAAMSGDTWENVTSGQTLNAGEGYIFHCVNDNSDSWSTDFVEFEFPAINNSNKNNLFNYNDVVKTIKEYPAEFSHNRGWNLIGNPYPSYMNSQYVDFPAPITVWNGNGYTAYSLADDEYVLRPNEAFFVQCPVNTNQIKFYKDGRTHNYMSSSSNSYYSRTRAQSSNNRSILNLTLSDENYSDRTRIVLNEAASYDYNIETDASKFMSNNGIVPQIYVIDNGINYAINERPLGAGEFSLGVKIGKEGNYKISLNAKNSDFDVLLIDKATNETTNLTSDSYTFESKATTLNDRFMIKVNANGGQSSIEGVLTDTVGFSVNGNKLSVEQNAMISIYSIDGKLIFNGMVDGSIELQSGIFLLSINNITHKIAIK